MKTRLQRTELLRAARVLSTPKRTAAMFLVALLTILTFPTKTWAQEPIAQIGDTPYESLQDAFRAAADGSTVTLLGDADLGNDLIDIEANEGERNLTFDLNNHRLTGTTVLLYVRIGVNLTVKGGTIGGPDTDNPCPMAIRTIGGKVNIENLTISNCIEGIFSGDDWPDEETTVTGEVTVGSGVHISATERCIINNSEGKLTLTALPILSWGETYCGIDLGDGKVINFAGEGITTLPEGFNPIKIWASGFPRVITNGYADHVKSGSKVIDPAKVFVGEYNDISLALFDDEAIMVYGRIQKVSVTKGDEVKEYFSLQTAFDEADDGSTVTLLDNADIGDSRIGIRADEGERNLTFDLNGKSLTGTDELLFITSGVNLTVKGGTIGGVDTDNPCYMAIHNIGGKVNVENLTIRNCNYGINEEVWLVDGMSVTGELTIGSGVNISATYRCINNSEGKMTLTALPILSCGEEIYDIFLREDQVIYFAGEGITELPTDFKPIRISASGEFPRVITNGYADHVKSGSEVIAPAKVFVGDYDDISIVLYDGEAMMAYGDFQMVRVTKGDEVKDYFSLQTAFEEAADGSTVTLLEDANLGGSMIYLMNYEGEKNLTFDLNGKSLTGTDGLFCVYIGVNLTVKGGGGTIGGPDADNPCAIAIRNIGGKVNIENLTISNCTIGINNENIGPDDGTSVPGELTIGSGVKISAKETCIDSYQGKLTLTALPILSWGEEGRGIILGEGKVINFAGEGITALPKGFKPIKIWADGELPRLITNGYADHVKRGSKVIDPAKVFVNRDDNISIVLYDGEAIMTNGNGDIQMVRVTKGNDEKLYLSLQTAFYRADDGSTITLLGDADLGETGIDIRFNGSERNLTFDLNGFSLTGKGDYALLYVNSGVNLTVKGGTIGGVDADTDNRRDVAIQNFGGKVNVENLTISNCDYGIDNTEDYQTYVPGELTVGSGVNISATETCISNYGGKLTLTALPILSWSEEGCGIALGEGEVINFAGEGITALPEGFKPIKIMALGELPRVITNGYSTFFKNINLADVFVVYVYYEEGKYTLGSITLEDGEVSATTIQKHSGDVNGDDKTDIADVVALTNAIIAGTTDLKYDINGDNQVTSDDIIALVNIISGGNGDE